MIKFTDEERVVISIQLNRNSSAATRKIYFTVIDIGKFHIVSRFYQRKERFGEIQVSEVFKYRKITDEKKGRLVWDGGS